MKTKKQESAKWSREMAVVEKKKREKEMEMNKLKPLFIKAKEQTLHVVKRMEASKYVRVESSLWDEGMVGRGTCCTCTHVLFSLWQVFCGCLKEAPNNVHVLDFA